MCPAMDSSGWDTKHLEVSWSDCTGAVNIISLPFIYLSIIHLSIIYHLSTISLSIYLSSINHHLPMDRFFFFKQSVCYSEFKSPSQKAREVGSLGFASWHLHLAVATLLLRFHCPSRDLWGPGKLLSDLVAQDDLDCGLVGPGPEGTAWSAPECPCLWQVSPGLHSDFYPRTSCL
jgi:hypothetical protein